MIEFDEKREAVYDEAVKKIISEVSSELVVLQVKAIGESIVDEFCEKLSDLVIDSIRYAMLGIEAIGPLTNDELDKISKMNDEEYEIFIKGRLLHK